jgi:hypothetical protein
MTQTGEFSLTVDTGFYAAHETVENQGMERDYEGDQKSEQYTRAHGREFRALWGEHQVRFSRHA